MARQSGLGGKRESLKSPSQTPTGAGCGMRQNRYSTPLMKPSGAGKSLTAQNSLAWLAESVSAPELDHLIDRYLRSEARDKPELGYPSIAAGTQLYRSSRQYQSANETLSEATSAAELTAMEGAWDSLSREHEQALRIDALNRMTETTVFRVPNKTPEETSDLITEAKRRLTNLLAIRGFYY